MFNNIRYFEEDCIRKFEKLEDDFMKNPLQMAEYILSNYTAAKIRLARREGVKEMILRSEKSRHGKLGKSIDRISHSISLQSKKIVYFNAHIWGL